MELNLCSLCEVQFTQTFITGLHEFHIIALSYGFFFMRLEVLIVVTEGYHFLGCHVMLYGTKLPTPLQNICKILLDSLAIPYIAVVWLILLLHIWRV
jgi:hypothetical protein